jgi:hypothetical protein
MAKSDWWARSVGTTSEGFSTLPRCVAGGLGRGDLFTGRVVIPEDGQFNVSNDYDWFSGIRQLKAAEAHRSLLFARNVAGPLRRSPARSFCTAERADIYTFGARPVEAGRAGAVGLPVRRGGQPATFAIHARCARKPAGARGICAGPRADTPSVRLGRHRGLGFEYAFGSETGIRKTGGIKRSQKPLSTNHKFYG